MTVQPEKILRELSNLWVGLGHEEGVLRACAMTLIVVCEGCGDVAEAGEALAELMRVHPSRAIVVRVVDEQEPRLDSRVFAQCWMPFGRRQQICCEQIEISATVSRLTDVYSAMLGLTVPDLPVIMWLRSARFLSMPEFQPLMRTARSIVLDSAGVPVAADALSAMEAARNGGWRIKDLCWTRLTRWREIVAQIFEKPATRARRIAGILVRHTGTEIPVEAWYAAAWLSARLPEAEVKFEPGVRILNNGLQGLLLDGDDLHISILPSGQAAVDVRVDTVSSRMVLPEMAEWRLVEEELSILSDDPVFEPTLELACHLARRKP